MSRGIYVALSGAVAQEAALDTTAMNLANASTPGYQRQRPIFREALSNAQGKPGNALRSVAIDSTALDGTRGSLTATGRPLDIALPEGVFLAVSTPRGERFTRSGGLRVAADGSLTTPSGAKLAREDGQPIVVNPTRETSISADGSVVQEGATVARLRLVKADAGGKFEHEGAGLLVARGAPPVPASGTIDVGALEDSNASVVGSMTDLIGASRTFEAFKSMLDTFGDIDRKVLTTVPTATDT